MNFRPGLAAAREIAYNLCIIKLTLARSILKSGPNAQLLTGTHICCTNKYGLLWRRWNEI
jgi:hypothetical protein